MGNRFDLVVVGSPVTLEAANMWNHWIDSTGKELLNASGEGTRKRTMGIHDESTPQSQTIGGEGVFLILALFPRNVFKPGMTEGKHKKYTLTPDGLALGRALIMDPHCPLPGALPARIQQLFSGGIDPVIPHVGCFQRHGTTNNNKIESIARGQLFFFYFFVTSSMTKSQGPISKDRDGHGQSRKKKKKKQKTADEVGMEKSEPLRTHIKAGRTSSY